MAWVYLIIAGLFEICWATSLKFTENFTKLWPSLFFLVTMVASMYFLSLAVKTLPLGTAYAIWTGIGAVGAVIAGIILFSEPATFYRILFVCMIVAGIVGLKISSAAS
jgi:quaternary ammonium compound-resistance protein SugE